MLVRQTRIDEADLNLFEFDYDLTFMVFFLNAAEDIYGRYGGRDAEGPDSRQSLAGLRFAAEAALATHGRARPPARARGPARSIGDFRAGRRQNCVHCHQVREILNDQLRRDGAWSRDAIWRYPLPDNLGFILDVDRGNRVAKVVSDSPAARAGIQPSDTIRTMDEIAVHSLADAQFALDRAPSQGTLAVSWSRGNQRHSGEIELAAGWRRTDLRWRASMRSLLPSARVYGRDLSAQERAALGLSSTQLAFWQGYPVSKAAQQAGIREGDVILGFDGKQLELEAYDFLGHVRGNYLVGDKVQVNLIRNQQRLTLPMILR